MAKEKPKSAPAEGWRQFVPFVGLLGAVVGVLLLGALLRAGIGDPRPAARIDTTPTPRQEPAVVDPVVDPVGAPNTLPASTRPGEPRLNELAGRAQSDLDRLSRDRKAWTLKLATVCDPSNAQRWLDQVGDERKLFFVPTLVDDRACFRLSWGQFDSRDRAAAARLPASLRSFASVEPRPALVEQVLR